MTPRAGRIFVHGTGAVSPAGWGSAALTAALMDGTPLPFQYRDCAETKRTCTVRTVPPPGERPGFLAHARLRRSSAVSQFAVGAALEALGADAATVLNGGFRLGVISAMMTAGIRYSRRFYEEVLQNPATASPLLFPETVFNAPASHVGAILNSSAANYTLVADQSAFVQALALAAAWLLAEEVDGCLVVAAEEADWLTAEALRLFPGGSVPTEGAGALYLRREPSFVELGAVTDPVMFVRGRSRADSAAAVRRQLPAGRPGDLLLDSGSGAPGDRAERAAWSDWLGRRISPKRVLGEGFAAAGAWPCVAAVAAVASGQASRSLVSVTGGNFQAIGALFTATGSSPDPFSLNRDPRLGETTLHV